MRAITPARKQEKKRCKCPHKGQYDSPRLAKSVMAVTEKSSNCDCPDYITRNTMSRVHFCLLPTAFGTAPHIIFGPLLSAVYGGTTGSLRERSCARGSEARLRALRPFVITGRVTHPESVCGFSEGSVMKNALAPEQK